jgi:hypothetical protein
MVDIDKGWRRITDGLTRVREAKAFEIFQLQDINAVTPMQ